MAAAVVLDMLQEDKMRKWELSVEFLKKLNLTKIINFKHGWKRMDDVEDTEQEMVLITFEAIQKYEDKIGKRFSGLNDITNEDKKNLAKMIAGHYRKTVWDNRSDRNMRMSDIYNIKHGSDDDTHLYFSNISENDIMDSEESIAAHDNAANDINNDLRAILCHNLVTILNSDVAKMVEASMLGTDLNGLLTHKEIACDYSKCRSAVTRRINRGIKILSNFIGKYNISWQQVNNPTEQDFIFINNIIREYKNKMSFKRRKIVCTSSELTIEYFLHISKCYVVINKKLEKENKENRKLFRSRKRSKVVPKINIAVNAHTIEEYM